MKVDVNYDSIELRLIGEYYPGFRGSKFEPPEERSFLIEAVIHKGEDIFELLSDDTLLLLAGEALSVIDDRAEAMADDLLQRRKDEH